MLKQVPEPLLAITVSMHWKLPIVIVAVPETFRRPICASRVRAVAHDAPLTITVG